MITIIEKNLENETHIKYDNILFMRYILSSFLSLIIFLSFLVNIISIFLKLKLIELNNYILFVFLVYTSFTIISRYFYPKKDIIFREDSLKINDKEKYYYENIEAVYIKKIKRGRQGASEFILILKSKGKENVIIEYGFLKDLEKILEVYKEYERKFKEKKL